MTNPAPKRIWVDVNDPPEVCVWGTAPMDTKGCPVCTEYVRADLVPAPAPPAGHVHDWFEVKATRTFHCIGCDDKIPAVAPIPKDGHREQ